MGLGCLLNCSFPEKSDIRHVRLGFPLDSTNDFRCLPSVDILMLRASSFLRNISLRFRFFFQCVIQKGLEWQIYCGSTIVVHCLAVCKNVQVRFQRHNFIKCVFLYTYESMKIIMIGPLLGGSNSQWRNHTRPGQAEAEKL